MSNRTTKRLFGGIIAIIILASCLCITTTALVISIISVENNVFQTGYVDIDLNGGVPIMEEDEILFVPGGTAEKDFYIKNNSSCSIYYKLYLDNVDGKLAELVTITISTEEHGVIYKGKAADLSRDKVSAGPTTLAIGQKQSFTVAFEFPSTADNNALGQEMKFDLCADAIQAPNNDPEHPFS